jgi:MFS family permease
MATAAVPARGGGAFAALHYRDYAIFWCGAMFSNTGQWMQAITAPYVVFQLTHSTAWVGFTAFMAFGPALLIGPVAGSLADRFPRKQVVLCTQVAMMAVAFALWGVVAAEVDSPGLIVGLLCVAGFAAGLNIASWQSLVPQLVPHDTMLSAIRLNSMQFTAARAFGPALAGLVLAEFGPATAILMNAVSYVIVISALLAVHPRPIDMPAQVPRIVEHFRAGVAYVRRNRALVLAVLTITALSFFGSSVVQLAAPLADEVFGVGKAEYGILVAAFGGGAVVGSAFTLAFGDRIARSRLALIGLVTFAAGEVLLGSAPSYGIGLFGLAGMGVAYILVAVSLNTSVQARVDESHRGRVLSIYLMGLLAGVPLGALLGGVLADGIGLRATIIGGGAVVLAFAALAVTTFDGMAPLDEGLEGEAPADDSLGTPMPITGAD